MLDELRIHIAKTANGADDYIQISSPSAAPVNIVLIAAKVTIDDQRKKKK